jgi:lambda family phage portal protein
MGIFDFLRRSTAAAEPAPRIAPVLTRNRRNYSAASVAPRYADFGASYMSADAELEIALDKLRARSRNLERNNPHARRYVQLMQDNIVGHMGFKLTVAARNNGGTGPLDVPGNRIIAAAYARWAKGAVTVDGMMTMVEAQRMAVRTYARDGEVLIQHKVGRKYRDAYGIRFIESDQLDHTLNRIYPGTKNRIRMGVEMDEDDRPIAYHILTTHPGEATWAINGRKWMRVPAAEITHIYVKNRAGQTRGEPPMCAVMNDAKMLAGYREAEITNRRTAASKMGFFERDADAGPVEGIADAEGDEGELITEVEPGKMTVLPAGYRFANFDPNSSSTDYVGFEKQIIRSIAAGLGPSYFDLAMDLSDVSYSSIRQGALSDRDFYRGLQRFFIDRFQNAVYAKWLDAFLDFGDSGIPSYRLDKFLTGSAFSGRGWAWVDPEKEVNAAIKAREGRLNSLTRQIAENGMDVNEIAEEIAAEDQMLERLGIPVISKNQPLQEGVAKTPPAT